MKFITAANKRFKQHAIDCSNSVWLKGYEMITYNLGGLGYGIPFTIKDDLFQETGCYKTKFTKWRSRAMHVCSIIAKTLTAMKQDELLIYMDADTRLLDRIDELETNPLCSLFDVGVTVRPMEERAELGKCNSGVVMMRYNLAALNFLNGWICETESSGSIQQGLNQAVDKTDCLVLEFPTAIYNNYHSPDNPPPGTKIVHFRASMTDV